MRNKVVDESGTEIEAAPWGDLTGMDRGKVAELARALLAGIPDAPDDDGSAILGRILAADNWEDMNTQAKLPNGKDMAGRQLKVHAMVKRPSEIEGEDDGTGLRLDHYLVIDSVDINNREVIRWQTSAPALVLPLAKLATWGKLPAIVRVAASEKTTRRGFRPLNLTVEAVS